MAWARESEGVETACLWERSAGSTRSHLRMSHALRHLFSKTHQLPRSPLKCWALPQLCGTRPLIFLADYSLLPNNYPRGEWSSRSSQRELVLEMWHTWCHVVHVFKPTDHAGICQVSTAPWWLCTLFKALPLCVSHAQADGREKNSLPAVVPVRSVQLGLTARQHPLHEAAWGPRMNPHDKQSMVPLITDCPMSWDVSQLPSLAFGLAMGLIHSCTG